MAAVAETARPARTWSVGRAMAHTGGASLASAVLSLLSTKTVAAVAGPAGLALLGTLQQIRQAALNAATGNGQTAVVQGVSSRQGLERREYVRTTLVLFAILTGIVCAAILAEPAWVMRAAGLPPEYAPLARWLVPALALSSVFVFLTAILNSLGAIGKLAILQLASPGIMAVVAYPAARSAASGHSGALAGLVTAAAAGSVICAGCALWEYRAVLAGWWKGTGRWWSLPAARAFLAISISMLVAGLVGSSATLYVRGRIASTEGLAATGVFDAAWAISMNQVTLVLASMQTYFLPALSRDANPARRSDHTAKVLRIAAPVSATVITTLLWTRPIVIHLLYSDAFLDASRYLRWTLVGDYLKVASWIFSISLLAAADMSAFLVGDLLAYATYVGAATGLRVWWSPAESAALAFALMYLVHLVFCGACAWRRHGIRLDRATVWRWFAGLACIAASAAWTGRGSL